MGVVNGQTAPPEPLLLVDVAYEKEPDWKFHKWALQPFVNEWRAYLAKIQILNEVGKVCSGV